MTGPRSPKISTFRGILLGTLDQYVADQPEKRWQLCDGLSRIDCLIESPRLSRRLQTLRGWSHEQQIDEVRTRGA